MTTTESINTTTPSGYYYNQHDDYVELMPTWGYAASAFVLFLIGFFGFFLNLMVIILMFKDKQLWTPLNLILFNLVCSDFSVSVLGNPFTLISALSHRWVFGKTMCVLYGFFMSLLGITSITTLTVLSFERYMMVSRPLVSHHLSMRGASFSIFLIWGYSIMLTTPPLFGWGSYVNEAANISCSINWEEQTFNTLTYIMFLFFMGWALPVGIISFSYLNIIRTMKNNALRMGRVTRAESRVTMMVLIMIITFMVAWTPYSILALIEQFAPHDIISPGIGVIPALVAKSSICYDPIIYVGMNTQFRASVKRIFGCGDKEDSMQERGIENTLMSPTKAVSHYNDNNIKLQYLNPNNNTVVAVTIYQDEDPEFLSETEASAEVKKNRSEKKKLTLIKSSFEEESSEMSLDIGGKHKNEETTFNITNKPNLESCLSSPTTETQSSHISGNGNVKNSECSDKKVDCNNMKENVAEDTFLNESRDLLNTEKNENDIGFDNFASSAWDEENSFLVKNKRYNLDSLEEYTQANSFDEPRVSVRRKSLANAYLKPKPDYTDLRRIKGASARRKSSSGSLLSGHTRKLSAALNDTKGNIVTRLMVDERERSKLMCFEGTRNLSQTKNNGREEML